MNHPDISGDVFRDLDLEQRGAIERNMRHLVYPAGKTFSSSQQEDGCFFLIKSGQVQIDKLSPQQRILRLFILEPRTIFGYMTSPEEWNISAKTITRCTIGVISHDVMHDILKSYPQVTFRLMELIGHRMREMENKMVEMAFKSAPQRLATIFLQLAGPSLSLQSSSPHFVIRYTHQQLAEIIGTHRETVTKIIRDFREGGMIRVDKKEICLIDKDELYRIANQPEAATHYGRMKR